MSSYPAIISCLVFYISWPNLFQVFLVEGTACIKGWFSLDFLDLGMVSVINFGHFFVIISPNISSASFSLTSKILIIICMLSHLILSHSLWIIYLVLFSFFHSYFSLHFCLADFCCPVFGFICSCLSSLRSADHTIKEGIVHSVMVFFISNISVWFLLKV